VIKTRDGAYFVSGDEHFIAQQFDGATCLKLRETLKKFGVTLSPENLEAISTGFVGWLETDGEATLVSRPAARKRSRRFVLSAVQNLHPDRLFDCDFPGFNSFTPCLCVVSRARRRAAASAWSLAEIIHQSGSLFRFESLALACLFAWGHRRARVFHGLTCKYFWRPVREIGFC